MTNTDNTPQGSQPSTRELLDALCTELDDHRHRRAAQARLAAQAAATTPAQAWRGATIELDRATRAYHQAIDGTERAASCCNFAWYDAARSTEREAAVRYALAVRGEHVTRAVMVDATRVAMGAGHATA